MDLLDRLLDHDRWATNTLLDVSRGLTNAQLDQEFDVGHRTLRATFAHMIPNVGFWTGLMNGHPVAEEEAGGWSIEELIARHEHDYDAFARLARQLRDEERLVEIYVDHYEVRKSMAGTILMVVEHNEWHRGEASHILARLGLPEVPEVDLGVWDYYQLNT
jgi:uncharacterized damage-inducible protein DinB